ncbi:MAG TPA: transglutaminase domain-containing protein [Methylomirabilota bacterium]|jgi:transglutaminase-like putative cysteine protease|nr:transglutaminase domain-containing protein [Methylomirabilota bacterium]
MKRRTFLKSAAASCAVVTLAAPRMARLVHAQTSGAWRTFEVTSRVDVPDPSGVTRAWVPLPLAAQTEYHRPLGNRWTGNATVARLVREPKYGAEFLYAEWATAQSAPALEIISTFSTRDRVLDLSAAPPPDVPKETPAALARYLQPTKLIPIDGLVYETSREITKGARTDVDKARAIYEWIVDNTFRDPKVRGCGLGDIKTMLETRYFGGKCADLNALFVGLARAAGVPARDLYGIRVADSKEFKSLGKSGDISKAQHCRAEFYDARYGWVPVDPADVRKVVLEEKPGLTLEAPEAKRARAKLFGQWEMNYLGYNWAHDVALPNSSGEPVPFLMYPQAETAGNRKDSLDPATFKYVLTSRETSV